MPSLDNVPRVVALPSFLDCSDDRVLRTVDETAPDWEKAPSGSLEDPLGVYPNIHPGVPNGALSNLQNSRSHGGGGLDAYHGVEFNQDSAPQTVPPDTLMHSPGPPPSPPSFQSHPNPTGGTMWDPSSGPVLARLDGITICDTDRISHVGGPSDPLGHLFWMAPAGSLRAHPVDPSWTSNWQSLQIHGEGGLGTSHHSRMGTLAHFSHGGFYPSNSLLSPTLYPAPYTRALPRELVDIILSHVGQRSEQRVTFDRWGDPEDIAKREVAGLSRVCRRWLLLLRPLLFHRLQLSSRSDIQFLLSVVRSPESAWLSNHIDTICLRISEEKDHVSHIRLLSSEWREIRVAAPAVRSLILDGTAVYPTWMFPWRQRDGLRILTTIRSMRITYFRFPSFSNLLRLISNASSLETIKLGEVYWRGSGLPRGYSTTFSNLRVVKCRECTNNIFAAWIFAAAAARWNPARKGRPDPASPMPSTTCTIMEVLDLFFGDAHCYVAAEKLFDCDDNYTFCVTVTGGESSTCCSIAFVTTPHPESKNGQADHMWVLRKVAVSIATIKRLLPSDKLDPETHAKRFEDWASLDCVLWQMIHLRSIDVYCGYGDADSEEHFDVMIDETRSLLPKVGTRVHETYSATVADSRDLAPNLFGHKWE